jgi:rhomboid protease GluP
VLPKTDIEISARAADLLARYPRDPRSHFFRAIAFVRARDSAGAERELRAALSNEETIRLVLGREFEMRVRGLLAIVLAQQGETDAAKREAKPACGSAETPKQTRGVMDQIHLCE